jgi:hypothetical protein
VVQVVTEGSRLVTVVDSMSLNIETVDLQMVTEANKPRGGGGHAANTNPLRILSQQPQHLACDFARFFTVCIN